MCHLAYLLYLHPRLPSGQNIVRGPNLAIYLTKLVACSLHMAWKFLVSKRANIGPKIYILLILIDFIDFIDFIEFH